MSLEIYVIDTFEHTNETCFTRALIKIQNSCWYGTMAVHIYSLYRVGATVYLSKIFPVQRCTSSPFSIEWSSSNIHKSSRHRATGASSAIDISLELRMFAITSRAHRAGLLVMKNPFGESALNGIRKMAVTQHAQGSPWRNHLP